MIDRALPGQILVGEFSCDMPLENTAGADVLSLNSIDFVVRATQSLAQLTGLELAGESIESIKCYLTGTRLNTGEFTVRRITINDKHGMSRNVFNAKVNIYRQDAEPILLGIEDKVLGSGSAPKSHSEHLLPSVGPPKGPSASERA